MEPLVNLIQSLGSVPVALTFLLSVIASAHVVLYKRDSRAAVAWVGLIWLAPIAGSVLYVLLGINRIRRQAVTQRTARRVITGETALPPVAPRPELLPPEVQHLHPLAELVDRISSRRIKPGNAITPLVNGDEAYPEMLAAIENAELTVALSTYIFDNDEVGRQFQEALERAVKRGVEVRVLVDESEWRCSVGPCGPGACRT
jgi:cardiolipin synthase